MGLWSGFKKGDSEYASRERIPREGLSRKLLEDTALIRYDLTRSLNGRRASGGVSGCEDTTCGGATG